MSNYTGARPANDRETRKGVGELVDEGRGGGGLFNDSVGGGGGEEERMTGGSYKVL